ncbi:MAG: arabinan endo-1,5-alpha-L-arabinosidase [Saprospiraceae bacterium]
MNFKKYIHSFLFLSIVFFMYSCGDDVIDNDSDNNSNNNNTNTNTSDTIDISTIKDTYYDITSFDNVYKWGPYNVHDPSIILDDGTYYCYSTDAAYGIDIRLGLQVRKSKDLIKWEFLGWVFNQLPSKGSAFIQSKGGTPNQGLWAPYVIKVGDEFRLYYSLASNLGRLSVIGLATSSSPIGPWVEKGIVVYSLNNADVGTNAIDPTILIDQSGRHWMYYGSSWDGIYILELNPDTGLALNSGDKGVRIAHRGFTGNTINGNIEGADIRYNPENDYYYLFIAYDWLETKYNVRVGRSKDPQGPFTDYNGTDMNLYSYNIPMILAPYKFNGHSGWQGVSHPTIFNDSEGNFYIANQGRPGVDHYLMVLHVRKIFWTDDGWPITSPERYAGLEQSEISGSDLIGQYEQITLGYSVVPGFSETQISPDFQTSVSLTLDENGTVNGDANSNWNFNYPNLTINLSNGVIEKFIVSYGRDWENNIYKTILFTGLNNEGTCIWAKKI